MTLNQIETALDAGRLEIAGGMPNKWYRCRRNGRTRKWKRSPDRWEIPIKYAFHGYATITPQTAQHYYREKAD
jgi:hypothetical protein